jgi:chitinase
MLLHSLLGSTVIFLALGLPQAYGFYAVTLAWAPPTQYTDGTPAAPADISGYILYYGTAPQQYTVEVDVGKVTSATVGGLRDATPYYVVATAYDTLGVESGFSAPEVVVSPPGGDDTTPPTVQITAPANNTAVPRKATITIAATASDNVGVTVVHFFVNGTRTCAAITPPYTCAWHVPAPPNRTYRLQATAYDAQGNSGMAPVVTVVAH